MPQAAGDTRAEFIAAARARAASFEKQQKADEARQIHEGLIALYGDDPAAAELLRPVREALAAGSAE